jgi:hypothetical protein
MSELASGHAAFETCSQIGVTNFMERRDDLSLNGVCLFHFVRRSHGLFMWRGWMSRDYCLRWSACGVGSVCGRGSRNS